MKWPGPIIEGRLVKRYKRFLADVMLPDGTMVTAHCANTGSMKTCMADDIPVWLTHHDDPRRKLKYSWQAARMPDGWVGINTALANGLVREAVESGLIETLTGYPTIKPEQKYGQNSRIDLLLKGEGRADCYVEVKNVTLLLEDGVAGFPDAVTQRGAKHLEELATVVEQGARAVLVYCVQRESAQRVAAARSFDPNYAETLARVIGRGVEVVAYAAAFNQDGVTLTHRLPLDLNT